MITWNGKLNLPFEERVHLRNDCLKLTQICKSEDGQASSEIALFETRRELESQRLQLHQAKQWADQAQREKTIDELSVQQERVRTTVSQLSTQIQDLQNKANSSDKVNSRTYDITIDCGANRFHRQRFA